MPSTWLKLAAAIAGASLVAGCGGIREHRGYVLDKELASGIQVGIDNKDSVARTLGRPTFTGQFSENDWYYLAQDTRAVAFRSTKVDSQTLLHVSFDQAGNVIGVNQTNEDAIVAIHPVKDKTPTLGRKRSFFDELFGNIGVFNSGALGQQQPSN